MPHARPSLAQISNLAQEDALKEAPESSHDPVGNNLVTSARKLTGTTLLPPLLKPPPKIGGVKTPQAREKKRRPQQQLEREEKMEPIDLTAQGQDYTKQEEAPRPSKRPEEDRRARATSSQRKTRSEERLSPRRKSPKRRSRSRSRSRKRREKTPTPELRRGRSRSHRRHERRRERSPIWRRRERGRPSSPRPARARYDPYRHRSPRSGRHPWHTRERRRSSTRDSHSGWRERRREEKQHESLVLKMLERTLNRLEARDSKARKGEEKAQKEAESGTTMMASSKANRENFQRWLTAPQSAGSINLKKIFKAIGYSVDVTRTDLPPAVAGILTLRVLRQAPNLEQMMRCLEWFLRVFEVGLRFERGNQLLEYIRRAMELRRASTGSWEDHDVWRAVDDHIMVAKNSKVKLERNTLDRAKAVMTGGSVSSSSSTSSSGSSSESSGAKKRKKKRKRKRAKKRRAKRKTAHIAPPTTTTVNTSRSPWITQSDLARNQCSACRKFGHWRQGCPTNPRPNNEKIQEQMNTNWICAV